MNEDWLVQTKVLLAKRDLRWIGIKAGASETKLADIAWDQAQKEKNENSSADQRRDQHQQALKNILRHRCFPVPLN